MEDDSVELWLQLSVDELAEVLEEYTALEFSDEQVASIRQLIQAAGSLEGALNLLNEFNSGAEAA